MQKNRQYKQTRKPTKKQGKCPFTKSDFETVLKAVTKPLKKEQGKKESGKT